MRLSMTTIAARPAAIAEQHNSIIAVHEGVDLYEISPSAQRRENYQQLCGMWKQLAESSEQDAPLAVAVNQSGVLDPEAVFFDAGCLLEVQRDRFGFLVHPLDVWGIEPELVRWFNDQNCYSVMAGIVSAVTFVTPIK